VRALITGATGQDGFYLSKFLLDKGYTVYGLKRRSSQPKDLPKGVIPIEGDVTDPSISRLIFELKPSEVYHLAAMSHVGESFKIPKTTFEINALGTLNVLEGVKETGSKFYQASTSELFGKSPPPQNETTPFHPRSPYGVSKLAAYWLTVNYREAYGVFACNGILFNHESPHRGLDFVTRKVCKGVSDILHKKQKFLTLGNLEAKRDWGHAEDFVEGMWLMLQQDFPDDYVLATGISHSVTDLLEIAFSHVGLNWKDFVRIDSEYFRPSDVDNLVGDFTKIGKLGWKPKITFEQLIKEMVDFEISRQYVG